MKGIELKPRAVAVLCALRSGPKTTNQLGSSIGDGVSASARNATAGLLDAMRHHASGALIQQVRGQPTRWYLDHDGLGWLQSNGLDAVFGAWAWNASDAETR